MLSTDKAGAAMILLYALYLYVLLGLATALAFVIFGVERVLPHSATMTVGARILLLPGATLFWPYVISRWINSGRAA